MSLLCELGWHAPAGLPRWNDGFYFARCRRCGRELVRTAYERWHVPKGFRIVWSDRPPTPRAKVALVSADQAPPGSGMAAASAALPDFPFPPSPPPPPAAPAAAEEAYPAQPKDPVAPAGTEAAAFDVEEAPPEIEGPSVSAGLPIQRVLDELRDAAATESLSPPIGGPLADASPVAPPPIPPLPVPAPPVPPPPVPPSPVAPPTVRRRIWDFMDEEPDEPRLDPQGSGAQGETVPTGMSVPADSEGREVRSVPLAERVKRARAWIVAAPTPWQALVLSALVALLVVAVVAYFLSRPGTGDFVANEIEVPAGISGWESPGTPKISQPAQKARATGPALYVTASVLSCRSAPVANAPRVRNLARGVQVRLVASAPPWASISYRGRQCWVAERYLSKPRPY